MRSAVISSLFIVIVEGQLGNIFGWPTQQQQPIQPQPIQPQWPWSQPQIQQPLSQNNLFGDFFNRFTLLPPPTTTTTVTPITLGIQLGNIPNPDLEQGNWPIPDPGNWPVGPDWNDERNSWEGEFGWGGKDANQVAPVSIIRATDVQE